MSKIKNVSFSYTEYENPDELNNDDRELVLSAQMAAQNAYAPYSKFKVGAALRLGSGRIVTGANVENAAFPSGICAERNAISHSVSNFPDDHPVAIAISAQTEDGLLDNSISPCGNCRQVMAEEELRNGKEIKVILSGKTKTVVISSISSLLPLQFNNRNLRIVLP